MHNFKEVVIDCKKSVIVSMKSSKFTFALSSLTSFNYLIKLRCVYDTFNYEYLMLYNFFYKTYSEKMKYLYQKVIVHLLKATLMETVLKNW